MSARTHYETLGLPADASQDAIRKRFRELARQYHPDVAKAPDAAARFRDINEAHQVLSNPERRAAYDAELTLARMRQERAQRQRQTPSSPPKPAPRPGDAGRPTPPRPTPRPAGSSPRPAPPPPATIAAKLTEAQRAFSRMRFRDAEMLCRQVLRIDRRNAVACEILGDIYRTRGRIEEANRMYSYAVQFDPKNHRVQAKIERLVGHASRGGVEWTAPGSPRGMTPGRALANGLGVAALVFVPVALSLLPSALPRDLTWPSTLVWPSWSPWLLLGLACAGFACGALMAVNGLLGHARDELATTGPRPKGRAMVPLGLLLLGFTLVSFYAAFLVYVLIGYSQETVARSVVRAFGAAFVLTAVCALACSSAGAALPVLAAGGNVLFPALIAGWFAGDRAR